MTYTINLTKRANNQINQALEWYAENTKGNEIKLLKAIDSALTFVQSNPFKSQIRYDDIRIKFLKGFKFGFHYFVVDETIYILGFFHQKQNTLNWKMLEA